MLFTCPSRYSFTIGHTGVFSLGGWSPQLPTGFRASRRTQELYYDQCLSFAYRALTVCGPPFQGSSAAFSSRVRRSYNPDMQARRFRLRPFRSPLLRASRLISLPPGTEMFQFPGFASTSPWMTELAPRRVAPFGHLGITACVPLPRASRSLPRPSSPLCAQASPTCLLSLDYKDLRQTELRALFQRVTFSCENVISIKDSSIPRSTMYVHCQIAPTRITPEGVRGRQSRVGGQNVTRRSDYEMRSPSRGRGTGDPLRR